MEEVYKDKNGGALYVGNDDDFWRAKEKGFFICTAAKDGPHGHRSVLKYTSQGAPKGPDYYFAYDGTKHLALNLVDADDPAFIRDEAIDEGLKFIKKHIENGQRVLVQCNKGHSRSPSIAMVFMRSIGDLPERYHEAFKIFKTLYPKYDPNLGMEHWVKSKFKSMKNKE